MTQTSEARLQSLTRSDKAPDAVPSLHRYLGNHYAQTMNATDGSGDSPPALTRLSPSPSGILQRKCACGNPARGGQCSECSKKQHLGLQTKLTVNEPGDIYEREAERVADQVMAVPPHATISETPARIQRFSGQSQGQTEAPPASVDHALASPGKPLEPALQQDMEQRFGYDFSRVRVHSGAAAEQSAQEVNAQAYTLGSDVVFGAGRFSPGTGAGRRLIAHELTHVVQQTGANGRRGTEKREPASLSSALNSDTQGLAGPTANGTQTASGRVPISGARCVIARKPQPGTTPALPLVREMARDEAQAVLMDYIARAQDESFAAMDAIVKTLSMSSTPENWKMRLRVLSAAFSLLDAESAASVLKALTIPVGDKQKYLNRRFNRLDVYFRTSLLAILRKRTTAKSIREERRAAEPPKAPSPVAKTAWVELHEGVFAYQVSAGTTINHVAAYLSGHPDLPNILAKLNNVSRTTPLEEGHPVIVSIDFIDRENAIRDMPEQVRSRIVATRQAGAYQAQYRRFVRVKSGHPLGPQAVGLIPVTTAAITAAGEALKYPAGLLVGLLKGAAKAVADLFVGAYDLIKTIGRLLYRLITLDFKGIWKMLTGWIDQLKLLWRKRGDIASDFMDKWEAKDGWDRGLFQGEVLGWVMMTVLIVILTAGAGAVAQIAGKWKFVIDALKLADRAGDLGTYARAVGKLPGTATNIVRNKLGRTAEHVPAKVTEKSAKEVVEKGATRGTKELPEAPRQAPTRQAAEKPQEATRGGRQAEEPALGAASDLLGSATTAEKLYRSKKFLEAKKELQPLIDQINPCQGTMNCVPVTIATDLSLATGKAFKAPVILETTGVKKVTTRTGPLEVSEAKEVASRRRVLESYVGANLKSTGARALFQELHRAGHGARAIIAKMGEEIGHAYNVINWRGTLIAVDGQSRTIRPFADVLAKMVKNNDDWTMMWYRTH